MKVAVIGNGIAARALLFRLSQISNIQIDQYHDDKLAHNCSLNTTSMVSLNGIVKGVSSLGDLIYDSYSYFLKNIVPSFKSVEYANQYYLGDLSKLKNRFNRIDQISKDTSGVKDHCYLISSNNFLKEIERKYISKISIKKEFITSVESLVGYDYKFFACGSFNYHLFKDTFDCENLTKSKLVPGHYLYKNIDLGDKSFVYTIDGEILIYRGSDKIMMIGGTSQKESSNPVETIDHSSLRNIYSKVNQLIDLQIPEYESFKIKTGIRVKGKGRSPFWGPVNKDSFLVNGLYKNGWTFAFKAPDDIMRHL